MLWGAFRLGGAPVRPATAAGIGGSIARGPASTGLDPRSNAAASGLRHPDPREPVITGDHAQPEARPIRRPKPASSPPDRNLLELTRASLEDDKAEDIVVIELAGKSTIADFMVIATGRSSRQVGAMAENLRRKLIETGIKRVAVEGLTQGDWVLLDAGDIIVHLFRPEVRAFYNLEKMWGADLPGEPPAEAATA